MRRGCVEIRAGLQGDAFLRECLQNGKEMGKRLSRLMDGVSGEVTVLLSSGARAAAGEELTSERAMREGAINSRAKDSWSCLSRKVQRFLADSAGNMFVIEDAMAERHHQFMSSSDRQALFLGDSVYWYLSANHQGDMETICDTCFIVGDWGSIGIMTSWPVRCPIWDRKDMTSSDLDLLVTNVQRIVVGAYDGEGYLIWYRGGWKG